MGIRVAVNCLSAQGLRTGVGYYTSQLFLCLQEQAGEDQVAGVPRGWIKRTREWWANRAQVAGPGRPQPPHCAAFATLGDVRHFVHMGFNYLTRRHLRRCLTPRNFDLYLEPNFLATPSDVPTVLTLHDLSVLLHPEWHPPRRVQLYRRDFERSLRQSVHFLTVSDFVRAEVVRVLGIPPERVTRTYNGVRPTLRPVPTEQVAATLHQLGLPPRYLLYLGTLEPRKNVLRLMQAYCQLPAAVRTDWPLLLVGGWGWRTETIADYYDREARHKGVRHVGYIADEHTAALYSGARALVFPSLYEGFGLPPMEMMACGGAVLASKAGALVETVGSHAHLVDAEDLDGWRQALLRVVRDEDWWRSLRRGVRERAALFTWERCAADTWRAFRQVVGGEAGKTVQLPKAA